MRQKLRMIAQILLLVSLPAFVLRPVVVTIENGVQSLSVSSVQKSVKAAQNTLIGAKASLRSVVREKSEIPSLTPSFTRLVLASVESLTFTSSAKVVGRTSCSPLILRI